MVKPKLIRNTSTPEGKAFWEGVKRSAALVKDAPNWMRGGIDLNPDNFVTYGSEKSHGKKLLT